MNLQRHLRIFAQAVVVWFLFWLLGLPDYYQQYSQLSLAIGSILLSVAISLVAVFGLLRGRASTRMPRALWISFYYTVPLAILDTLYCGIYLGHGAAYLEKFWYLAIFYLTPWLTFPPTAALLNRASKHSNSPLPPPA